MNNVLGTPHTQNEAEIALMEWMHIYRIDSAHHHLQAIHDANLNRFCSLEACMFFTDISVVTINCALR